MEACPSWVEVFKKLNVSLLQQAFGAVPAPSEHIGVALPTADKADALNLIHWLSK